MSEKATGVELIAAERTRQIEVEGYTLEHDEMFHGVDVLVTAAAAYLGRAPWPWSPEKFKKADGDGYYVTRNLVKAGALIAAAIDRMSEAGQ